MLAQDLLILSPPRPRNSQVDISDLLEHCVTVGEEVGDVLDQFEERVMIVVPGDLSPGHRPSTDLPALQPPASLLRRLDNMERGELCVVSCVVRGGGGRHYIADTLPNSHIITVNSYITPSKISNLICHTSHL